MTTSPTDSEHLLCGQRRLAFAVPGFSKCGTTTLCELLRRHPGIYIPQNKEPGYFSEYFDWGWDWYAGYFEEAPPQAILGDGSTMYSCGEYAERARDRMLDHNPDMRFVFIARNPVKRLESSFREMHHSGYKYGLSASFDLGEALRELPNMLADSRYWRLINIYRERVPDERMLVLFLEEFEQNPQRELARCCEFLGVDPAVRIESSRERFNPGSKKYRDTPLLRKLERSRWTRRAWQWMPLSYQQKLFEVVGLREPFRERVHWSPDAIRQVREHLLDDARQFLAHYGKSEEFWGSLFRLSATSPGSRKAA